MRIAQCSVVPWSLVFSLCFCINLHYEFCFFVCRNLFLALWYEHTSIRCKTSTKSKNSSQAHNFIKLFFYLKVSPSVPSRSQNKICQAVTSPKNKQMNRFFYPDDSEILKTWISISSFKYFWVLRIEKQICSFFFGEKFRHDNFVSISTDL